MLNHKPALMRAYKQTCLKDGGDGDAWVEPPEFPMLLLNLFYFNKLFQLFDDVDADDDRRLDLAEFREGLGLLGFDLSPADAEAEFAAMDGDGGGKILFDEFCVWYTGKVRHALPWTMPVYASACVRWGARAPWCVDCVDCVVCGVYHSSRPCADVFVCVSTKQQ